MLNKKILATAVAVAFSSSALADVNLTANNVNDSVRVATEALVAADFNGDGFVEMINPAANGASDEYLDVQTVMGFTVGASTSKYIRINLTGGEFGTTPVVTILDDTGAPIGAGLEAVLSQGGEGENFAVYEVAAPAGVDIESDFQVVIEGAEYLVNPAGASSISVSTYDDAGDAVNQVDPLFSDSKAFTNVASVVTGDISNPRTSVATVGSNFLAFQVTTGGALNSTTGRVGELDVADYLAPGTSYDNEGNIVGLGDVLETTTSVAVYGDFSFGTWYLSADNCTTATEALEINDDEDVATSDSFDTTALGGKYDVCVSVPALNSAGPFNTINKGSYSIELLDDEIENDIGAIVYNTVSVEVPYITTFSDYNQRLYIVNNGRQDALYTMAFTAEDGTTVTPGAASTGTIPAGEMVALKATDVVVLTGKTRVSAVIEIEAEDADITAASQSVNLETGGTDTVVLN